MGMLSVGGFNLCLEASKPEEEFTTKAAEAETDQERHGMLYKAQI